MNFYKESKFRKRDWSQKGQVKWGSKNVKKPNMSHHRIHFQGKGSLIVNNLYSAVGVGGGGGGGGGVGEGRGCSS